MAEKIWVMHDGNWTAYILYTNKRKTSNALIQHIRDMVRTDPLHELVLLYLEEHFQYSSASGYMNSRVRHKSLYPMYSAEYNLALKCETQYNAIEE